MKKLHKSIILVLILTLSILQLTGCSKNVTNEKYKLVISNTTYTGTYSGKVNSNKVPVGNGTFKSGEPKKNNYYYYKGSWKNGKPNGQGKLNLKDSSYTGELKNGQPNGSGSRYIHTKQNSYSEKGTFRNCAYKPTEVQAVESLGTLHSSAFSTFKWKMTQAQKSFIKNHSGMIFNHDNDTIQASINADFDSSAFLNDRNSVKPAIVTVKNLKIVDIKQFTLWGKKISYFTLENNDTSYALYYFGSYDYRVGDTVTINFMPINHQYKAATGSNTGQYVGFIGVIVGLNSTTSSGSNMAYQSIVNAYRQTLSNAEITDGIMSKAQSGLDADGYYEWDGDDLCYSVSNTDETDPSIYYTYYDIDGDGIQELIFASGDGGAGSSTLDGKVILSIWTRKEYTPIWLIASEYRGLVHIDEQGQIYQVLSGGANYNDVSYYTIKNNALNKVKNTDSYDDSNDLSVSLNWIQLQ
jgi:hypothetical protein